MTAEQLQKAAKLVLEVNEKYSKLIGINVAARTTAVKPEGTASCVLGSSSGIHARHSKYYLRRIRLNKEESLAKYLKLVVPDLVEDDLFSNRDIVVTIPQESPEGSIIREEESANSLLDRVLFYNENWVKPGHRSGTARHNVSCTINYKADEVELLSKRLWEERNVYSGISLLPFDGGNYQQAPFEACNESKFQEMNRLVKDIDLTKVLEMDDQTNMAEQLACAGGVCEIR
jgi:ribonucleoside-diphosphate reductase alpha chain